MRAPAGPLPAAVLTLAVASVALLVALVLPQARQAAGLVAALLALPVLLGTYAAFDALAEAPRHSSERRAAQLALLLHLLALGPILVIVHLLGIGTPWHLHAP